MRYSDRKYAGRKRRRYTDRKRVRYADRKEYAEKKSGRQISAKRRAYRLESDARK